jgi:hypothetical protein
LPFTVQAYEHFKQLNDAKTFVCEKESKEGALITKQYYAVRENK